MTRPAPANPLTKELARAFMEAVLPALDVLRVGAEAGKRDPSFSDAAFRAVAASRVLLAATEDWSRLDGPWAPPGTSATDARIVN
jgi:hypothetical protein